MGKNYSFFSISPNLLKMLLNVSISVKQTILGKWSCVHNKDKVWKLMLTFEILCNLKESMHIRGSTHNLFFALHNLFSELYFIFIVYIYKSGIARSNGSSIFSFLRITPSFKVFKLKSKHMTLKMYTGYLKCLR